MSILISFGNTPSTPSTKLIVSSTERHSARFALAKSATLLPAKQPKTAFHQTRPAGIIVKNDPPIISPAAKSPLMTFSPCL